MQKTILRYGFYGVGVMLIILVADFLIFKEKENWEVQEVVGYATIVLSLSFVYFGIRHWRDAYNNGLLSFVQGLKLGTIITIFPSIAFGLFTLLQMNILDPEFSNNYYNHYTQKLRASTPPDKLQDALQKLESEKEMFSSPLVQFGAMFLTVFFIGMVITVISALILQRTESKRKISVTA